MFVIVILHAKRLMAKRLQNSNYYIFIFDGLREVQMESLYMLFVVALFANKTAYKIASVQYYK